MDSQPVRPRATTIRNRVIAIFGLLAFALPTAACAESPVIEISRARSHPNAGVPVGVLYVRLRNTGTRDDRLLAIETTAATMAELHESISDGPIVRMKHRPEGFAIPSGATIDLEPGGKHGMLMQLTRDLVLGESIEITLVFEHAGRIAVRVPIESRSS